MTVQYRREISKVPIVIKYEFLKQVRRFRLYGLMLVGSLVTFVGILLAAVLGSSVGPLSALGFVYIAISAGGSLFGLTAFVVIAGVFFSGDAISSEFEHKTGYLMFVNPIKRTTLLIGKYLSSCIACALMIMVPYLVVSFGVVLIYGEFPSEILLSYLFAVLYACSVCALTFVFSSLFRGSMGASILPFLLFYFIFPVISSLIMLGDIEPFFFLNYGAQIVYNILLSPYPPNKTPPIPITAGGMTINVVEYFAGLTEGIIIITSYLVVSLFLSALLLRRRQMM